MSLLGCDNMNFDNMTKEGLVLYRILGDLDTGMELSFRLPNTAIGRIAKIDIFLHYPGKNKNKNKISWFSYVAPEFKKKIEYRVSKFKLEEVDFMGLKVPEVLLSGNHKEIERWRKDNSKKIEGLHH